MALSISNPRRLRNVQTQFTPDDARRFCDRFGCRQDTQGFYENPAINDLVKHADFEHARSVLEVGCGTGSFACRLFETVVPADARYIGLDISGTMIGLATRRLEPWQDRTEVDRRMAPWCAGQARMTQWSNWHARTLWRSPPVTVSSCFSTKASSRSTC